MTYNKVAARWLVDHRHLLAALSVLLVALAALGIPKFRFTSDLHSFFHADDPYKLKYDQFTRDFAAANSVIIGVTPAEGDVLSRPNLQALADLTRKAQLLPYASNVESLSNTLYAHGSGDALSVEPLFGDVEALDTAAYEERMQYARRSLLVQKRLISPEGDFAAIHVKIEWPREGSRVEALFKVEQALQEYERAVAREHPQMIIRYAGDVILEAGMVQTAKSDLYVLVPIIATVCTLILFSVIRSPLLLGAITQVILASVIASAGLACWLGVVQNQVSVMTLAVVLVLTMAGTLHLVLSYLEYMHAGLDRRAATLKSLEVNIWPMFLTTLTTAIGFLTLNLAGSPTFSFIGNMAAVGESLGYLLNLTLMPALLIALPVKAPTAPVKTTRLMGWIADVAIRHRRPIFWGLLAFTAFTAAFVPSNDMHDDIIGYFDERMELRRDTDFISERLGGRQKLVFAIDAGLAEGINDIAYLSELESFAAWLRQQPEVSAVYSYEDIVKTINQTVHQGDAAHYRLPESASAAAQYLLLYELNLTYGQDLSQYIKPDKSAVAVVAVVKRLSNEQMLQLESRALNWLSANTTHAHYSASEDLMFAALGQGVISGMAVGSVLSVVLIGILLVWGLRSLRFGLLSFVPNIMPSIIIYGLWGLLVGEVNMAAAVTFSVSLGLVVDDTIHVFSKYLTAAREGLAPEAAIRHTFLSTGPALFLTSSVMAAGYAVEAFSVFGIHSTIGLMVTLTIVVAGLCDVFFGPSLLLSRFVVRHTGVAADRPAVAVAAAAPSAAGREAS